MIFETLIGSALGSVARLIPEILTWLDKKDERKHELALLDKNLEADKFKAEHQIHLVQAENEAAVNLEELRGLIEVSGKQTNLKSGVAWIDGFNSLIRPLLAFQWLILLWPAVITFKAYILYRTGADLAQYVDVLFGSDEKALASSVASFFLVDRALRRLREPKS